MSKGYILAEVEITDRTLFEEYRKLVSATLHPFGGRFLVRGGEPVRLEGDRPLHRFVVIEFDSPERARDWYHSKQYQDVLPLRLRSARTHAFLLTGVAPA
jgi:uncharacterized protein (DUF1330 family)